MLVMDCLGVNEKKNLTIGGLDVADLAKEYRTPLYIMDEDAIRSNMRIYREALEKNYDGNGLILYASKAFCCKHIYRVAMEEGLGVDVVSGGEMYTAKQAGFPMEKVYFHGNNKTPDELSMALSYGVGRIVVDNDIELETLNELAGKAGIIAKVLFRIKPGIDAHTHEFIMTGQIDSKFGVALETGEAEEIVKKAASLPNIEVVGAHCHIGSQIFDIAPFESAAEKMMHFIADMRPYADLTELNLGGGYGIKYLPDDDPVPYGDYIGRIADIVKKIAKDRGIDTPSILMEPGRSLVAPCGITVYTVGNVKKIPKARTYVSVDGGMADNPRYILYQSEYEVIPVSDPLRPKEMTVTVAGKCCESGDLLARDIELPAVKPGDLLAVQATGAYNYSMASNYNRIPRPPVIMVKGGSSMVAVRRETYADLVQNDA